MLIPLLDDLVEEIRIHNSYRETQCLVVRTELSESRGLAKSSRSTTDVDYHLRAQLQYQLDGRAVTAFGFASRNFEQGLDGERARAFAELYAAGKTVPCFYDPKNPERAVLVSDWGDRRRYLLFIPTGGAVLFGTVMSFIVIADRRPRRRRPAFD